MPPQFSLIEYEITLRQIEDNSEKERDIERESGVSFMLSFTTAYRSLWVIKAPGEKADNLSPE